MVAVQQKKLTAQEFWSILQQPEFASRQMELVEGVIHEMAGGAGGDHGEIAMEAGRVIGNFVKERRLGRVTAAETCYILYQNPSGKDTVRCPDVGFIALERAPQPLEPGFVPYAPDFAVEVVSPGNEASEMHNKVLDYLRYGTRLIWIIYPDSKTVVVHTHSGARIFWLEDTLDGGDVLPGFSLPVREIFPA